MDIVATGMVCSVGLTAASACAALRARVSGFKELPYLDGQGNPIVGARVPEVMPDFVKPGERLVDLLTLAMGDCFRASPAAMPPKLPLVLGLAEADRPGGGAGLGELIIRETERRTGLRFHETLSRTIELGHTSGFHGLLEARRVLNRSDVPVCLVCAVDSYINGRSLVWLEKLARLKTIDNSDGVIPGEAAVCVLVRRPGEAGDGGGARVAGLGFARETATVLNEEPLRGFGLAGAARSALAEAGLAMHEVDFRLSDVTGESYGFREFALLEARLLRVRRDGMPFWHCADAIGDTGAAAGLCQIVIADYAFRKDYAPGGRALGVTSSVTEDRAAAVVVRCDVGQPAAARSGLARARSV